MSGRARRAPITPAFVLLYALALTGTAGGLYMALNRDELKHGACKELLEQPENRFLFIHSHPILYCGVVEVAEDRKNWPKPPLYVRGESQRMIRRMAKKKKEEQEQ